MYEAREDRPVLTPPPGFDPDWEAKIEAARAAREAGRRARQGKPSSFRYAIGRS